MSYAILYQSALSQQLSNLKLTGIVTIDAYSNTDSGKLYGSFSYSSPTYTFNLYSDSARTQLVASATASTSGIATIIQQNDSGISGSINILPGTVVNDSGIEAICLFSSDGDIPLDNLTGTSDYDPIYGFSVFHQHAFDYVKNVVQSRFESMLWNPGLLDVSQINGGKGGFDLSKCLSWRSPDIREASAQYVLHLIARKQAVEPDGMFAERAKCAYERCAALLQNIEMQFDVDGTRVPQKTRTMATFRFGRA